MQSNQNTNQRINTMIQAHQAAQPLPWANFTADDADYTAIYQQKEQNNFHTSMSTAGINERDGDKGLTRQNAILHHSQNSAFQPYQRPANQALNINAIPLQTTQNLQRSTFSHSQNSAFQPYQRSSNQEERKTPEHSPHR